MRQPEVFLEATVLRVLNYLNVGLNLEAVRSLC